MPWVGSSWGISISLSPPPPPSTPRHTHSHLRFITSDMSCLDYYNSLNLLSLPSARGSHFLYLRHKKSINNLSCCDVSTRDWEGDSTGLETCSAPVFWGGGGRDEESRGLGLSCRLSEAFSLEVQTHFLALRNQDSSYTRVFLSFWKRKASLYCQDHGSSQWHFNSE